MDHALGHNPALMIALALAAGVFAQAVARHIGIPGIVLLLATGALLGPDLLGIIQPQALGHTIHALVGFAVAIILFEGGLNLQFARIRRQASSIRRLISIGAVVTMVGAALTARILLDWDWTRSLLFGTLVIVTGPTVINPLLRRIRVRRSLATVLEAEGVLIDAIGAVVAVVALEVVLTPTGGHLAQSSWGVFSRMGLGMLMGAGGGLFLAGVLRLPRLVPEGLENVFTLAMVLALFQVADTLVTESGIVAVTTAGILVGNTKTKALAELREFKEQLTILFIGLLFVLLAADVRLAELETMGWAGIATVLALMLVVRPVNVMLSTAGSDLNLREKLFLSWVAPRGIVAAAVSSLFADRLNAAGIAGGPELRALVFLVIAITVVVQGLTGATVAQLLGVRRPSEMGFTILGARDLALCVGELLRNSGQEVLFLDSNPDACRAAEERGFRVLYGNGLAESLLLRAQLDGRAGTISITANDGLNLLFAQKARDHFKVPRAWVALRYGHTSVTREMVEDAGAHVLFGTPRRLELWSLRLERNQAAVMEWELTEEQEDEQNVLAHEKEDSRHLFLPLMVNRGKKALLLDETVELQEGDRLMALVFLREMPKVEQWFVEHGWQKVEKEGADSEGTGTSDAVPPDGEFGQLN
ncbi:MAG: sodium:proton antiporter [bacterium]|nr:sodium:proton antiporter [bacterium]